ncbi:MAG: hypothetical protein GX561_07785 [Lentisphaerae bacterium]|jgi:hypothetical protein|nr:hypothetical protein [Lentisphaerota bacterium]
MGLGLWDVALGFVGIEFLGRVGRVIHHSSFIIHHSGLVGPGALIFPQKIQLRKFNVYLLEKVLTICFGIAIIFQ